MVDFDERDLLRHAEQAGFPEIRLDLEVTVANAKQPVPWERFLRISGNPLVPSVGEALDRTLTLEEIAQFTAHLKPLVESGTGQERRIVAYLTAALGARIPRLRASSELPDRYTSLASASRRKAVVCAIAAPAAFVSRRALTIMKSWMAPP
jgi:hypothetical protein